MSQHLRIIQVINVRWFNATAWYALFISRLLKRAGHEVLVIGLANTASFKKAQEWGLAPVALDLNTVNPARLAKAYAQLSAIVKEFSPDVVNCHRGEGFFLWGGVRSAQCPFALIRTRGDQRPPKHTFINRLIHKYGADALIATNSATAFEFIHYLRYPEERVFTIEGGVDTDIFIYDADGRERVRKEFGIAKEDFVIGFLGRFDPVKGVHELVQAVGSVCAQRAEAKLPACKLLLAGFSENIDESTVRGWLQTYGLENLGIITGKRADVVACISAMDLGVVASQGSEAIARAAFEIMSCGIPLVGTRIGVMPDLVPAEALVPVGDQQALNDLLLLASTNAEWRNTIREKELEVMATFSEQHFLQATLSAYEAGIKHYKKLQ